QGNAPKLKPTRTKKLNHAPDADQHRTCGLRRARRTQDRRRHPSHIAHDANASDCATPPNLPMPAKNTPKPQACNASPKQTKKLPATLKLTKATRNRQLPPQNA
ncbi:MAG: hypothetical protein Q8N96_07815, partial [Methylovulum sp.]|nr:hypothetical protein [Methylovulum sp.]